MPEPPESVVEEAERLTRLALDASDDGEADAYRERRDGLLAECGYAARERDDGEGEVTLVCYPADWLDESGTIRVERVDPAAAVEVSLSGPGDPEEWADVDEHNRAVARRVHAEHGGVHGATATALAAFASDHYAKPVEALTEGELAEFREEYFVRNAWPSDEQRERVAESLRYARDAAEETSESSHG